MHADANLSIVSQGYSEFRLSRYPTATKLINQYMQGSDPKNSLGPYWERPGRTILDNHLLDVPPPDAAAPGKFSAFERVFFAGDRWRPGPWNLGRWGRPVGMYACAFVGLMLPILCFPAVRGAALTAQTMNWCVVPIAARRAS